MLPVSGSAVMSAPMAWHGTRRGSGWGQLRVMLGDRDALCSQPRLGRIQPHLTASLLGRRVPELVRCPPLDAVLLADAGDSPPVGIFREWGFLSGPSGRFRLPRLLAWRHGRLSPGSSQLIPLQFALRGDEAVVLLRSFQIGFEYRLRPWPHESSGVVASPFVFVLPERPNPHNSRLGYDLLQVAGPKLTQLAWPASNQSLDPNHVADHFREMRDGCIDDGVCNRLPFWSFGSLRSPLSQERHRGEGSVDGRWHEFPADGPLEDQPDRLHRRVDIHPGATPRVSCGVLATFQGLVDELLHELMEEEWAELGRRHIVESPERSDAHPCEIHG